MIFEINAFSIPLHCGFYSFLSLYFFIKNFYKIFSLSF